MITGANSIKIVGFYNLLYRNCTIVLFKKCEFVLMCAAHGIWAASLLFLLGEAAICLQLCKVYKMTQNREVYTILSSGRILGPNRITKMCTSQSSARFRCQADLSLSQDAVE